MSPARERSKHILRDVEVLRHERRGKVAQPLSKRHLLIVVALEGFEEHELVVASVLDVVTEVPAHYAYVPGSEVGGARVRAGVEHSHTP